jgi:beta-lactam-binding protein with PASTA domain
VIPQARSMLSEIGLTLGARNEASGDTVSKGQIIKQNPEAGTEIKAGGSVNATVSSGTSTVEVPRLTGLSRDQAKDKLHATGLMLGMVTKAFRENMPEGKILEQYPVAGTEAERGRDVRVTISGPREATTVRVGAATRRDGHAESPDSGEQTRSNKGMIVALTLVVLLGIGGFLLYQILATPQPQHTSQPQEIVVPDLIGMDVANAKEQVGENFHIYVEGASVLPGMGACRGISGSHQICDQEPKAGKRKPKGSTISVLRTS